MASTCDLPKMSPAERRFLTRETTWRDKLIDHEMLKANIPLSTPVHSTRPLACTAPSLGDLDHLPLELMHQLFSNLSVADVLSVLRLNTRSRSLISSWPTFVLVNRYGENALRALIATGTAHRFTLPQLESVVITTDCEICQEHGEILYLPTLRRCCFHCLSTDRRLLAVNAGYAAKFLNLPRDILQTLPILTTAPHEHHWSIKLGRVQMVDYTTALSLSTNKETDWCTKRPCPRQPMSSTQLKPAGDFWVLPQKYRSIQPRPSRSIQKRRKVTNDLPSLSLPWTVTRPQEGPSGQHACSVFLPAVKRISVKIPGTQCSYFKYEIHSAMHCSGCAHFWKYHSALPYEYHTMHRGSISDTSSLLMVHLKHCVYAQMMWQKLSGLDQHRAKSMIEHHNRNQLFIRRWGSSDTRLNAAWFERLTYADVDMVEQNEGISGKFTQDTVWPIHHKANGRKLGEIVVPAVEKDVRDMYGDLLFSQEALSQANWATAAPMSRNDLFHGPVKLVMEKRGRETRRIQKQRRHGENVGTRGIWQGPWSFDHFG